MVNFENQEFPTFGCHGCLSENLPLKHSRKILPSTFSDTIMPTFAFQVHNITTRHSKYHNYQFESHQMSTKAYNSFTTNCIRIWNTVPQLLKLQADIQECSVKNFSIKLRDHYLWVANNTY